MQLLSRQFSRLAAVVTAAAIVAVVPAAARAGPTVVFVDDSAPQGGDGSAEQPVQTIQEGIALLPKKGGIVAIHPGAYFGPIRVERDDVVLWGLADPVYDADGFLAGFTSEDLDDDEVVITIDRPLEEEDPAPGDPEDLLKLHGSDNEAHNLVVDSRNVPANASNAAFSAAAEDDDFYDNIVFSHIIVRGAVELGGYSAKANAVFEYITSLEPGLVGIWAMADGDVEVRKAHIVRKAANVVFVASDEQPKDENGPSFLTGRLVDSKLSKANGFEGFFTDGTGLLVLGRKNAVNPDAASTILLEAAGNTFADNHRGVTIRLVHGPNGFSIEPTLVSLDFHDNTYVDNHGRDVQVSFQAPPWSGNYFAANSSVLVEDADGVFPEPADVDLGPAENENDYELNP